MGTIERNIGNLHDQDTGKLVGYRNPVTGKDESLDAASVQALVSRDWILNGANVGASSAWVPFAPGQRIAYALDSGTTSTTATVDYSFDGGASVAGQAYTISYASSTAFEVGALLVSAYFIGLVNAAKQAGAFTGYFFRVTVTGGGPLSVLNNI